jgi:CRP-like cAMP-binding protein
MPKMPQIAAKQYPCESCPLRPLPPFRAFETEEVEFISSFKKGELSVDKGATVIVEGSHSAHLFTVLSGWGFRYKLLPDGRRQILNFIVNGDFVGLQAGLSLEMQHSVEALTPMLLCVFERGHLRQLYEKHPDLAFDVTWLAAREEQMLDEHLLSVGRRSALERAAYLIVVPASARRAVPQCRHAEQTHSHHPAACRRHTGAVDCPHQQDLAQTFRQDPHRLGRWRLRSSGRERVVGDCRMGRSRRQQAAAVVGGALYSRAERLFHVKLGRNITTSAAFAV